MAAPRLMLLSPLIMLFLLIPCAALAGLDVTRLTAYGFVASRTEPAIAVLDLATATVAARIGITAPAHQMAVAEGQAELIVGSLEDHTVNVVDLRSLKVARSVALDHEPEHMQLSPDGRTLAVGNFYADALTLVNLDDMTTRPVAGLAQPHNIVFDPDGSRLFVANLGLDEVSVVDVADASVSGLIAVPRPAGSAPGITDLAPSRDGRRLVAIPSSGSEIVSLDIERGVALRRDAVGPQPWLVALTSDDRFVLSANVGDASLSLVDAGAGGELARLPGSHDVTGLVPAWFGSVALLLSGDPAQALFVDLETFAALPPIALPSRPLAALPSSDGARIFVTLAEGDRIAILDPRDRTVERMIEAVVAAPGDIVGVGSRNICD